MAAKETMTEGGENPGVGCKESGAKESPQEGAKRG